MTEFKKDLYDVRDGYKINIAHTGKGPAIVCIHGSGPGATGVSNFRGNASAFAEAGYSVILPDLIGYGESSKPEGLDYTLDLFVGTLYDALKAHGVEKAVLVGNSLGGAVALRMALDHPDFVSSLILLAPGSIQDVSAYFVMPGIQYMVNSFTSDEFDIEAQRKILQFLVHPDYAPKVSDELLKERFEGAKTQPKDVLKRMKLDNLGPHLSKLKLPMLVFWGQEDQMCPVTGANVILEACDNARVVTFTRTGHWAHVEQQAEFNAYSAAFLKSLT